MTRYRWVAARKAEGFPITAACKVAEVSTTAFDDWRRRGAAGPTDAECAEAALVAVIREIHDETDGTYGEPRMTPELRDRGWAVNHKRVERLMRVHGIVGVHKPPRVRTTIPAEHAPPLPDLIGRLFDPGAPDVAWVGDITYSAQLRVMCSSSGGALMSRRPRVRRAAHNHSCSRKAKRWAFGRNRAGAGPGSARRLSVASL